MSSFLWTPGHCVHLPEVDAEHRALFGAAAGFQEAIAKKAPLSDLEATARALLSELDGHFTHEETLMREARYSLLDWHKKQHESLRKRARQFVRRLSKGDAAAGPEFLAYLGPCLRDHMAVADNMMGAAIRNYLRMHAA